MSINQHILQKYASTIAEEVNVKHVSLLGDDIHVTKTYIPLWQRLSSKFWKDTGKIIWAAKQGNVEELGEGQLKVFQWDDFWILETGEYEIRYSWLDENTQTVEDGVIVDLDLELTDELIAEWIAREISRFLNQMRKEAAYDVSDRVMCYRETKSTQLASVIYEFSEFLSTEALLKNIVEGKEKGNLEKVFESDEGNIVFNLKK